MDAAHAMPPAFSEKNKENTFKCRLCGVVYALWRSQVDEPNARLPELCEACLRSAERNFVRSMGHTPIAKAWTRL